MVNVTRTQKRREIYSECVDEWNKLSKDGKERYKKIESLEREALAKKEDIGVEHDIIKERKQPVSGFNRFLRCCYVRKGIDIEKEVEE